MRGNYIVANAAVTTLLFAGMMTGCSTSEESLGESSDRISEAIPLQATLDALGPQCGAFSPGTSCSLSVRDVDTGEVASYRGGQAYISASAVKAVWVAAALQETSVDTVAPLVEPVFARSDNYVSGRVIDLLSSPDRINAFMWNDVGMRGSSYCQWGFGGVPRVASNCNYMLGGDNFFTSDDGALFMEGIAKGTVLGAEKSAALLEWMKLSPRAGYGGWMGSRLPDEARASMAHKAGWLPPPGSRITNEIGLVTVPGGHRYAVGMAMEGGYDYDGQQLPMMEYASCVIYHAVAKDTADPFSACGAPAKGENPSCSVHGDGRLYCSNGPAPMYAGPHFGDAVVDHLRTTESWFACWGRGDLHEGGNTTWYRTIGDDTGQWGWVPASYLQTSSAFDADPSAHGLAACD
jgi:beta-lactamase class A